MTWICHPLSEKEQISLRYPFRKIDFAAIIPSTTPQRLRDIFKSAFKTPSAYLCEENSSTVSKLKVEKVLRPPNKPVFMNNLICGEIKPVCRSIPMIKPINNPAITFETSVPKGKATPKFLKKTASKYLKHEPKNPPTPT